MQKTIRKRVRPRATRLATDGRLLLCSIGRGIPLGDPPLLGTRSKLAAGAIGGVISSGSGGGTEEGALREGRSNLASRSVGRVISSGRGGGTKGKSDCMGLDMEAIGYLPLVGQ